MARITAASVPSIDIPLFLRGMFSRVIQSRRAFTAAFELMDPGNPSNQSHEAFSDLLQSACDTLFSTVVLEGAETEPSDDEPAEAPIDEPISLAKRFNGLSIEKPTDDDVSPLERPAMPPVVVVVPDETGAEREVFMSTVSYLFGLKNVRNIVCDSWRKYTDEHDLVLPSFITNIAIDLARLEEAEFDRRTTKRPTKFPKDIYPTKKLPALLFCHLNGLLDNQEIVDSMLAPHYEGIPAIDFRKYGPKAAENADLTFFEIFQACQYFSQHTGVVRQFIIQDCGSFKVRGNTEHTPVHARILEILQLGKLETLASPNRFAEDEISYGIRNFVAPEADAKTGDISIWFMLALQLHIDIEDIIAEKAAKAEKIGALYTLPLKEFKETVRLLSERVDKSAEAKVPWARSS
jgi:hypothetical protein